ncbi:formate--tetrahydrofolate ligase [Micrococcus sp. EYE_162]|uniref:formate--tetrahydrofolate ligase n=1 Tax=unclassified Micrococcus TaxID=2620948 RepID=UPI002006400A|nr:MULTISPECIES: formate--tetrahydrofolate ligase [unclassified Micrococcus]MCK6095571.1 formate--tetrahydrofolate ligase [Micrococcus sp. EYE_212]MCK6171646.1 formate--tetrahydrofolate ligase [Micrococcus sp. EYE_162]
MNDAEIAAAHPIRPIAEIAAEAGIAEDLLIPYGRHMAKVDVHALTAPERGRVVLVTGISPTPAGEGKTTVTVGLADGLNLLAQQPDAPGAVAGARTVVALREPSLGPVFGIKGGATGGGRAQVVPMEDINLHFTGDFHAITSVHNLLCALVDNHVQQGNALGIDPRTIALKRALDMNDRTLRDVVTGLGGRTQGVPREGGFEITVATETMAVFCLAADLADLKARLGRITVGYTYDGEAVTASQIGPNGAQGAMAVLLKDAIEPNLVQTLGGTPALVHGGPFANIAHGANSVIATRTARRLGDLVVTEAGFGADLGGQKFMDITAVAGGFPPAAAVVVATVRALKLQAGIALPDVKAGVAEAAERSGRGLADVRAEHVDALRAGLANLERHVGNMRAYGVPVVVAVNRFTQDDDAELDVLRAWGVENGVPVAVADVWGGGGEGALELARLLGEHLPAPGEPAPPLTGLWTEGMEVEERIQAVVRRVYGGAGAELSPVARRQLAQLRARGLDRLPVCMAKTQYSFSDDPTLLNAPEGFTVSVRELSAKTGAGFVVALTGAVMTMPGLPASPAADRMDVADDGTVTGLF